MKVINQVFGEKFAAYHGDCIEVMRGMPDSSMDFVIYSPPFNSLYTYSNSDRDLGNCRSYEEFSIQYGFVVRELYRVLKPGRLCSVHCMNLPLSKQSDGVIGLRDFRGDIIRVHQSEEFIYHSEVCIWKNPVVAMQRTKALGLLHKQVVKDSAMSRQGIPDYLVTFRKRGENPDPVTGELTKFNCEMDDEEFEEYLREQFVNSPHRANMKFSTFRSIMIWQRVASPVWMDIDPSDTLQRESAREEKDERHVCPLQLGVIRRAVRLWTNENDVVFSPFGGIGSEGYVAVQEGRRAVLAELKDSYFEQLVRNLQTAEVQSGQGVMALSA